MDLDDDDNARRSEGGTPSSDHDRLQESHLEDDTALPIGARIVYHPLLDGEYKTQFHYDGLF